jgi:hypothetical protein
MPQGVGWIDGPGQRPFLRVQNAEAGPDDLAGIVVAPAGDQARDQFLKVLGQGDIHDANAGIDAKRGQRDRPENE